MEIKRVTSQHGRDFTALLACEHCGNEQKITTGYDDAHYHRYVIPAITCSACGRNRAGDVPAQRNDRGMLPVPGGAA